MGKKRCKLCHCWFEISELSAEHYAAKSVGNDDIVALNLGDMFDYLLDSDKMQKFLADMNTEEKFDKKLDAEFFETQYPKGRVAYTLCRECNTFLGKYDEAYKKFFVNGGDPKIVNGFSQKTKIQIVKAIYAKFLSLPECQGIKFDFIDYLRNMEQFTYDGLWKIYFLKRDEKTDILNIRSLCTGMLEYKEGMVFELSDEKFIFHLTNFKPQSHVTGLDLFSIQEKYKLFGGENINESGGYHGEILIVNLLSGT